MDDPFINSKKATTVIHGQDVSLNDTVDPPGGEDLSTFRDSFLGSSKEAPRIAITADELRRLESKILGMREETLDAEIEELIRSGLITPSQRNEIRSLARELTQATGTTRLAMLDKVKSAVLQSVGQRVRIKGKKSQLEAPLTDAAIYGMLQAQLKASERPHVETKQPDTAGASVVAPLQSRSSGPSIGAETSEALMTLGKEEAKRNQAEEMQAEQAVIEERKVINEIYLETGEVIDGNFRIINRDNKQVVKEEAIKKREARRDLPEY